MLIESTILLTTILMGIVSRVTIATHNFARKVGLKDMAYMPRLSLLHVSRYDAKQPAERES